MNCPSCASELAPRATFCNNCGHRIEDPYVGAMLNDRYRIDSKIAIGGFGSIYKATQLNIGRDVAIKIMHPELAADAHLVARFRREGVVLCNLRDAHTVTTYELDQTADGRLFIVMELLTGTTLYDQFQREGRVPWRRMFQIARAMCSALAEAHGLGVVHRDLKPANIFLEPRHGGADFVKVLDFGIAKVMHESGINDGAELTVMGQAVGTLEYMAPEQLMGGKCDGRTDIYTVGVLAYEMITGRRPFGAAGLELLTVQLSETPVPPSQLSDVPPLAEHVLLRCLDHDMEKRYADVGELSRAIDEVLASERVPTPMPFAALAQPASIPPTPHHAVAAVAPSPIPPTPYPPVAPSPFGAPLAAPLPRMPDQYPTPPPLPPTLQVGRLIAAILLLLALAAGVITALVTR